MIIWQSNQSAYAASDWSLLYMYSLPRYSQHRIHFLMHKPFEYIYMQTNLIRCICSSSRLLQRSQLLQQIILIFIPAICSYGKRKYIQFKNVVLLTFCFSCCNMNIMLWLSHSYTYAVQWRGFVGCCVIRVCWSPKAPKMFKSVIALSTIRIPLSWN